MSKNISKHITFDEAIRSDRAKKLGLKNEPNEAQICCMRAVAEMCFEPIRVWWDKPLFITSFFRSAEVNRANNGKPTSQHCKGEAIDFTSGNKADNKIIYDWIKQNLKYDQLIWENGGAWIHISFTLSERGNRQMAFDATQIIPK